MDIMLARRLVEGGSVTVVLPALRAAVYDGALEGQLCAVFDASKRRIVLLDVYPKSATLKKGTPPLLPLSPPLRCCHRSALSSTHAPPPLSASGISLFHVSSKRPACNGLTSIPSLQRAVATTSERRAKVAGHSSRFRCRNGAPERAPRCASNGKGMRSRACLRIR